jgi:parvulin-like peptidyl-prolyl isomerase
VREIVVGDEGLADQLARRLRADEPFPPLARAYSLDPPAYWQQGGDLGWIGEQQMPMEWSAVVFHLSAGQTSPAFQVDDRYYIVQVIEGPTYDVAPFEAVVSAVTQQAPQYDQKYRLLRWLTELILREPLDVRIRSYETPIHTALQDLRQHLNQMLPYNL